MVSRCDLNLHFSSQVENLSMCLFAIRISLLVKCLAHRFCPLLFCFCSIIRVFYTKYNKFCTGHIFSSTFFLFVSCLLVFLIVSFEEQKFAFDDYLRTFKLVFLIQCSSLVKIDFVEMLGSYPQ